MNTDQLLKVFLKLKNVLECKLCRNREFLQKVFQKIQGKHEMVERANNNKMSLWGKRIALNLSGSGDVRWQIKL